MRKGFIVRQRSLSSLPSKQLSVNEFMNQKSVALQTYRSKMFQESKELTEKDEDISKLKINLDNAVKLAVNEALMSSRAKEQSMRSTQTKLHIQKKYSQVCDQLHGQKDLRMKAENTILQLQYQLDKQKDSKQSYLNKFNGTKEQLMQLKEDLKQIQVLQKKLKQIQPLKNRIKVLEANIRNQKLMVDKIQKEKKVLQTTIQDLTKKLKQTKPYQEQLQQRIAYLERVYLQLQRKMQDFNRRQHEYKKEVTHYKTSLSKMTTDRNKYRSILEEKLKILEEKIEYIKKLEQSVDEKTKTISSLETRLEQMTKRYLELDQKLRNTVDFYRSVAEENQLLKKRNKALQEYQAQVRRTLQSHIKVSEQTNAYIISRNSEVQKYQEVNKKLNYMLQHLQKKFTKFDKLFEEGSVRGQNQIKQSFYATIRANDKFQIEISLLKKEFNEKVLKYGEERDILQRKLQFYQAPIPTEQNLFQAIIADKTEEILMLQSSNDQLIKIKKQQQERIVQLQNLAQESKKQAYALRLKAAQLFKTKRDLEEANKKITRYQQMIEEQKQNISDLNSQMEILRSKNSEYSQRSYNLELQNKNLSFKIAELEGIMKELDIEYLQNKKKENEKNAHVITDSVQKLNNGINSLAFFFSCSFCGEMLVNPITLVSCGHNFCPNCKDAYAEYCYQCDTGQNIEKIFSNKFLKDAVTKYKFLLMVVKQAKNNLIKINM